MRRFVLATVILVVVAVPLSAAPAGQAHIPLPAELSGTIGGVQYLIRVPGEWNGTLLVYAHAGATGEVELAPQTFPPASPTLDEQLLSRGYALASSFYPGSEKDAPLLTLEVTNFFKGHVGKPQRTIVWGVSLGGTVVLDLLETYPGIYDGGVAIAAVGAGRTGDADFMLRYDLAYAAAFGWPEEYWGPIEDVTDELALNSGVETLLMPVFQWADDSNFAQWEFVRLVMRLSEEAWWDYDPVTGLWGYAVDGWKATCYRAILEWMCGGPVGENVGDVYTLTSGEKAYLSGLGLDAEPLLDWMNAHTNIEARHSARVLAGQWGSPTGKLRGPVVAMHGVFDPILPVSNEAVYAGLVAAAGRSDQLVQVYVNAIGHMGISSEQYLAALDALEHWLDTGNRPDASFFPAALGFDNTFTPPAWPY